MRGGCAGGAEQQCIRPQRWCDAVVVGPLELGDGGAVLVVEQVVHRLSRKTEDTAALRSAMLCRVALDDHGAVRAALQCVGDVVGGHGG